MHGFIVRRPERDIQIRSFMMLMGVHPILNPTSMDLLTFQRLGDIRESRGNTDMPSSLDGKAHCSSFMIQVSSTRAKDLPPVVRDTLTSLPLNLLGFRQIQPQTERYTIDI